MPCIALITEDGLELISEDGSILVTENSNCSVASLTRIKAIVHSKLLYSNFRAGGVKAVLRDAGHLVARMTDE